MRSSVVVLEDIVVEYLEDIRPRIDAPDNCPPTVPIAGLTSTGVGGTSPPAEVTFLDSLNAYIYFGGVDYDIHGDATRTRVVNSWFDCECHYTVDVEVTWTDDFDFGPTAFAGVPKLRLINRYYNAGHWLQTAAPRPCPLIHFSITYQDTFIWVAE